MIKKLKSNLGETLVEALAAIVIIALTAVTIMTASITAARINKEAREAHIYFTNGKDIASESEIHISYPNALGEDSIQVVIYEDNGGNDEAVFSYHYYEMR